MRPTDERDADFTEPKETKRELVGAYFVGIVIVVAIFLAVIEINLHPNLWKALPSPHEREAANRVRVGSVVFDSKRVSNVFANESSREMGEYLPDWEQNGRVRIAAMKGCTVSVHQLHSDDIIVHTAGGDSAFSKSYQVQGIKQITGVC